MLMRCPQAHTSFMKAPFKLIVPDSVGCRNMPVPLANRKTSFSAVPAISMFSAITTASSGKLEPAGRVKVPRMCSIWIAGAAITALQIKAVAAHRE